MEIEVRMESGATVVSPAGDIVAAAVPELKDRLRDLVRSGVRQLILDLGATYMIDSMGIGLLLAAHNSIYAAGGRLALSNVSDDLLELFRNLRIHQHMSVSGRAAECA